MQGDIGNYNAYINKGCALVRDIITLTDSADIKTAQTELEEVKYLTQTALDAALPNDIKARDRAIELSLQNKQEAALDMFHEEARPYLLECVNSGQDFYYNYTNCLHNFGSCTCIGRCEKYFTPGKSLYAAATAAFRGRFSY